jgi:predicted MPP superfamily phosphohydrolase
MIAALIIALSVCAAIVMLRERRRIVIREIDLSQGGPALRIVHFSDLHYKGDRELFESVVRIVNGLAPDFACFTGDIVENSSYVDEALGILRGIRCPVYGVPGNHEYRSGARVEEIERAFGSTGGAWLADRTASPRGGILIIGLAARPKESLIRIHGPRRILLTHYPETVDQLHGEVFDLILAGHSHGGQIRIPFWGAPLVPPGTGPYQKGLYRTTAGPLSVNPGIGTFSVPVRIFCPAEVTVIRF